jgi:WD40 repeat protein
VRTRPQVVKPTKDFARAIKNTVFEDALQRALFITGSLLSTAIFLFSLFRIISNNAPVPNEPAIQLWAVRFIGDGNSLATVGGNGSPYETPRRGELAVWDLKTCRKKFVLKQKAAVRGVAASPDGKFLAIGDFDGRTKLLDALTGETLSVLQSDAAINAVAFSRSSNLIVSGNLGEKITIWDTIKRTTESLLLTNEAVLNVAISSDGNAIVATTRSGNAYLFNLLYPNERKKLRTYDDPTIDAPNAEAVAFAPDGRSFATACRNQVRLWGCPSGKLIRDFTTPKNINSIAFSTDGTTLAAVDSGGTLALWDSLTGECRASTNAHVGISFCVAFSSNGRRIATIGRDDFSTKIWDAQTLTPVITLLSTN